MEFRAVFLSIALLPLLMLPAPAVQQEAEAIVVPPGWAVEVYVPDVSGALGLRWRENGNLLVGAYRKVLEVAPGGVVLGVRAEGEFLAMAIDEGPDGTLYIADPLFVSWGNSTLWAVQPGATAVYMVAEGFKYCEGVAVLPDGDVLAVDAGWINTASPMDGRVVRLKAGDAGVHIKDLPDELDNELRNPMSLEFGPDGRLYMMDRFYYRVEPGKVFAWTPGESDAQVVLDGLNDPHDAAWGPDGAMYLLDFDYEAGNPGMILRWDPEAGDAAAWAWGFGAPQGIEIAPNGDVFVADGRAACVYRIYRPKPPVQLEMSVEPETLNLGSRGSSVLARVTSEVAVDPDTVAITAVDGAPVGPIPALSVWQTGVGFHAKFDRAALQAVLTPGTREIRVEGRLSEDSPFAAADTITVINP